MEQKYPYLCLIVLILVISVIIFQNIFETLPFSKVSKKSET